MFKKLAVTLAFAAIAPLAASAQQPFDSTAVAPECDAAVSGSPTMLAFITCRGAFVGNTNNTGLTSYLDTQFDGTFTYLGESGDANFGPFGNNPSGNDGTLSFDGSLGGMFVLGLKAGNQMSFYLFNGGSQSSVLYNTLGTSVNGQGTGNGLSHAALWSAGGATITSVPEPSTYALMATGLLGIFGFARRRRNNA